MTNGTDDSSSMMNNGVMQDIGSLANSVTGDAPPYGKACAGCGARILDRFLLHAMDRYWHTGCLKCSCCQTNLEQLGSCFTRSGMILCKNDYLRMFGSGGLCSGCGQNIPPSELVMRAQASVYHVNCFKCVTCHTPLAPGDRFCVINGGVFCEQDYPKVLKGHMQNGSPRANHKMYLNGEDLHALPKADCDKSKENKKPMRVNLTPEINNNEEKQDSRQ